MVELAKEVPGYARPWLKQLTQLPIPRTVTFLHNIIGFSFDEAAIAVGHTLLVIIYHILAEEKDYQELGGNYFDEWDRQAVQKRLVRRLEKLGYEVTLTPTSPAA